MDKNYIVSWQSDLENTKAWKIVELSVDFVIMIKRLYVDVNLL